MRYVLGFALNVPLGAFLLVKKTRGPQINHGKWNGIGGKAEYGESSLSAMIREWKEETGLESPDWTLIGCMESNNVMDNTTIQVFTAVCPTAIVRSKNDVGEALCLMGVKGILRVVEPENSIFAQNVQTIVQHVLTGSGFLKLLF